MESVKPIESERSEQNVLIHLIYIIILLMIVGFIIGFVFGRYIAPYPKPINLFEINKIT
jgi:hypothetical protein